MLIEKLSARHAGAQGQKLQAVEKGSHKYQVVTIGFQMMENVKQQPLRFDCLCQCARQEGNTIQHADANFLL